MGLSDGPSGFSHNMMYSPGGTDFYRVNQTGKDDLIVSLTHKLVSLTPTYSLFHSVSLALARKIQKCVVTKKYYCSLPRSYIITSWFFLLFFDVHFALLSFNFARSICVCFIGLHVLETFGRGGSRRKKRWSWEINECKDKSVYVAHYVVNTLSVLLGMKIISKICFILFRSVNIFKNNN